jgi:flagellar motor switch protein FliN/FliY
MAVSEAVVVDSTRKPAQSACKAGIQEHPENGNSPSGEIARILGLSVPISVTLAERDFRLEALTSVTVGTILEFEVPADAELTLYAANQPIGKGVAVKVGENFGIRVTRIGTLRERIDAFHH